MAVHQHLGKGIQLPNDTLFSVLGNGRKWQSAIASRSTSSPARLVVFGDSITEGLDASAGSYIGRIKKRLAPYNNFRLSPGWVHGSPNVAPLYSPYRFGLTTDAGGNADDAHSLSRNGYSLTSGSTLTLRDATGTNITTSTGPYWDKVEVHYCVFGTAASAGSLTVAIDGVNQTAINTLDVSVGTGNYEIRTVTYSVTRGQHTLTVTGSGGQPSLFGGVYLSDGDTVWVYQAGDSGTKVSVYNTAPTTGGSPLQGAKAIDADCILDNHGVNDFADGVATSTTNFSTFFTNAKLAYATGSDVPSLGYLLPFPAQGRSTTSPPWAHFVGSWKAAMAALDVPVCDFSTMLAADAATTDPFQLIDDTGTANTHPLDAGAEYMADQLARFLGIPVFDWVAGLTSALINDQNSAIFTGLSFVAGVTVTKHDTGKAYIQLRDDKNTLSASTGLIGELGMGGRGATALLGSSGVNSLAWLRFRVPSGTWSDTSAPLDLEFGNCASSSVTSAVRMTLSAGGGLLFPTAATSTITGASVLTAVPADQTADYTLVATDGGSSIGVNSASAHNVTVPPNSSVAFPVGTTLEVRQVGVGQVTIVAGAGVTLRSKGGALKSSAQYGVIGLLKLATDTWSVRWDITT